MIFWTKRIWAKIFTHHCLKNYPICRRKKSCCKKTLAAWELIENDSDNDPQAERKWDVLLRKNQVNPDDLSDNDWCRQVQEQIYLRKMEDERFKNNLLEVLYELAEKIYR